MRSSINLREAASLAYEELVEEGDLEPSAESVEERASEIMESWVMHRVNGAQNTLVRTKHKFFDD